MEKHYQSFFGNKCALIINSNYETGDFYLNFIQEINKNWETYKEGLNIKLNPKEICDINEVLEAGKGNTKIIHKYQEQKKDFWIGFEKKQTDLVFSVKGRNEVRSHQKSFFGGEFRLLKNLLKHIEGEFIEFTTKYIITQK